MRKTDVEALIRRSRKALPEIEARYNADLQSKQVSDDLKIDIKNFFENLRSCLDYIAHDLNEATMGGSKPKRLYFPIRRSRAEFDKAITESFSGMETLLPGCHAAIERAQPYNDSWLGNFNKLNNNNKHQKLAQQTRTEVAKTTVTRPGTGGVSWTSGVRFSGNIRVMGVPIDPKTQLPVPNREVETRVEKWVNFRFEETGQSAFPFLKESVDKVEALVETVYEELGS